MKGLLKIYLKSTHTLARAKMFGEFIQPKKEGKLTLSMFNRQIYNHLTYNEEEYSNEENEEQVPKHFHHHTIMSDLLPCILCLDISIVSNRHICPKLTPGRTHG